MGPFSRRAKGEAGGEYIKRLLFFIHMRGKLGPLQARKSLRPLYIAYSSSTWQVPSSGLAQTGQ